MSVEEELHSPSPSIAGQDVGRQRIEIGRHADLPAQRPGLARRTLRLRGRAEFRHHFIVRRDQDRSPLASLTQKPGHVFPELPHADLLGQRVIVRRGMGGTPFLWSTQMCTQSRIRRQGKTGAGSQSRRPRLGSSGAGSGGNNGRHDGRQGRGGHRRRRRHRAGDRDHDGGGRRQGDRRRHRRLADRRGRVGQPGASRPSR